MKYYFAPLLAFVFFACNKNDSVITSNIEPQPGQLQLATLASAKNNDHDIPVQDSTSATYEFDLGAANSSQQRFFILKNLGDRDVRNIVLTTNNPHFYFSPSVIKVLPPSKKSSVLQVITLNVIHGDRLNGVGMDSLLPMGNNLASAHISGSTTNGSGDSLIVVEDVGFQIFANVVDFKIYKSCGTEADLSRYGLDYATMQAFTFAPVPIYWDVANDTIRMVNTGNSAFSVRIWHVDANYVPVFFDSLNVQSGDSIRVAPAYIEIDGHGVTTNPSKIYMQPDRNGRIYMAL